MNILELAPRKGSATRKVTSSKVSYSWHKQKKGSDREAFQITLKRDIVNIAGYSEGDRATISIGDDMKVLTISMGQIGDIGITKSTAGSNYYIKFSYDGVQALKAMFPSGTSMPLKLIGTSTGKIQVEMPKL
jgi:hypothetical protein